MPGADLTQALLVAERLRAAVEGMRIEIVERPRSPGATDAPPPLIVTASLGISTLGDADAGPSAMLERADQAMYRAKHGGRNRCVSLAPGDAA